MVCCEGKCAITLHVNGQAHDVLVRPGDLLLDVLRGQLGLTGPKPGCKNGDCGACTVIVDTLPNKSCLMLAVEAQGKKIVTVEGLDDLPGVRKAFVDADAFQCGYCTSGFLTVCAAMKMRHPVLPDEVVIEEWLQSNLCRCTSYKEIRKAVHLMYGEEG